MGIELCKYIYTVCPRSLDPIYIVTYCIKWVKTHETHLCNFQQCGYNPKSIGLKYTVTVCSVREVLTHLYSKSLYEMGQVF